MLWFEVNTGLVSMRAYSESSQTGMGPRAHTHTHFPSQHYIVMRFLFLSLRLSLCLPVCLSLCLSLSYRQALTSVLLTMGTAITCVWLPLAGERACAPMTTYL